MKTHKVVTVEKESNNNHPFNPHNGNLADTLDHESLDGWTLVSFDWNTWRSAIFAKEAEA